jgi:hypothetical protein
VKRILTIGNEIGRSVETILVGPVERLRAVSGQEALTLHRARHCNVIAFGLEIPDMPAEGFVRRIREDETTRDVSLLLLCEDTPADTLRAARCSANAVVRPSTDHAALGVAVRRLLRIPPRTDLRTLMRVSFPDPSRRPPFVFARSRNISTAGILLEARRGLGRGERVACSFPLPSGAALSAAGEIVRVVDEVDEAPSLYGIAWRELSPEAWASIDGYVARFRSRAAGRGNA